MTLVAVAEWHWVTLFLAQETGGIPTDISAISGYGAVSAIAILGLTLAWRNYLQTDKERHELQIKVDELHLARLHAVEEHQAKVDALHQERLRAVEEHKDECLEVYKTVMSAMQESTAAVKASARALEDRRLDGRVG